MSRDKQPTWWAQVDPGRVPLPHGTEVATRYERVHDNKVIPQGSVGRVQQIVGEDELDVRLVGWGILRFSRADVVARKAGQMRYALRREAAWQALSPCVVAEAVVGSRAWGLSHEGSDTDRRGVFVLPFEWTTALFAAPQDLVSADGSHSHWELAKLITQALRADPNTLELLFVDTVQARDPIGQWLLDERDAFVSREIYASFGRYALSQLKKLNQSQRLHRHRVSITEWLRRDPGLTLHQVARKLAEHSDMEAPSAADAELRAKRYVQQLYRSLFDQGRLSQRDFPSLVSFASEQDAPDELPRELRPKNAYNLIRLIDSATCWLRDGVPSLKVRGDIRGRLLEIKNGRVPLDDVLADAEAMMPALEQARSSSPLPPEPNRTAADALLRRVRHEVARRHVTAEAGVFGCDAPTLALAGEHPAASTEELQR